MATVKLLHSTKIPAGFRRPVQAMLMGDVEAESKRLWMLEPSDDLGQKGAMMEVALVELDEKQQVTLVVNNTMRLTLTQKDELVKLLLQYSDVFVLEDELGATSAAQHAINTGVHPPPVNQHPRRVPHALKGKIQELIDDMMWRNVIRPSQSPWASPMVLVTKHDGSTRFCVDYRRLNSLTKLDTFPLPRIDDYLDTLAGAIFLCPRSCIRVLAGDDGARFHVRHPCRTI